MSYPLIYLIVYVLSVLNVSPNNVSHASSFFLIFEDYPAYPVLKQINNYITAEQSFLLLFFRRNFPLFNNLFLISFYHFPSSLTTLPTALKHLNLLDNNIPVIISQFWLSPLLHSVFMHLICRLFFSPSLNIFLRKSSVFPLDVR